MNRCNAAPAPGNDYSGCTLSQDFSFADLTRANFDRAQIKSRFAGATLVGAKFREITGAGIDFPKAVLDEADFGLAKVGWLNLDGASARRVNFAGIDISGSRLVDTDLTGSWFMDANLDESYMHDADLSRANFSGAKLRAVDCSVQPKMVGTILIGATLFRSQFDVATILEAVLCNTTMPDGTVNNRDC